MENFTALLLMSLLALFFAHSHQYSQHRLLSEFSERRRSANESPTHEWTPPSINFDHIYPQDGLQENDKIIALPGQPVNVTFAQYSGYVTVDKEAGRALFYYFAEAAENPSTKPLLLWLNGGTGCSSFGMGAMNELGPFRVQPDGATLTSNPYAWNQVANTLFLESPAGIGFSYSNTTDDYKNGTDENTGLDSYIFLLNWLERFPQYKNREFYIGGESYAGYYLPGLADIILENNSSRTSFLNLKGVMDVTSMDGLDGFDPSNLGYVSTYLNTHEVQRALHASVTSLPFAWDMCSYVLWYSTNATNMLPIYQRMIASGLRILAYSGDVDSVLQAIGSSYSNNALYLPLQIKWVPQMNEDVDVGDYYVIYKGLIYATVGGAGHQVPSYQPSRALTMIKYFFSWKTPTITEIQHFDINVSP